MAPCGASWPPLVPSCRRHSGRPRWDLSHGAWAHCFSVLSLSAWPFVPQCGRHSSGALGRAGGRRHLTPRDSVPSPRSPETLFPLGHRVESFLVHCSGHASCHRHPPRHRCRARQPTRFRQHWWMCPVSEPSGRPRRVSHLRDCLPVSDPLCGLRGPSHLDLVLTYLFFFGW